MNERIRREREALGLAPWQFAPSEVDDGPPPYSPTCVGHRSWLEAQALRRELEAQAPRPRDQETKR